MNCICHKISFAKIEEHIKQNAITSVDELIASGSCCSKCGLCIPYVKDLIAKNKN